MALFPNEIPSSLSRVANAQTAAATSTSTSREVIISSATPTENRHKRVSLAPGANVRKGEIAFAESS